MYNATVHRKCKNECLSVPIPNELYGDSFQWLLGKWQYILRKKKVSTQLIFS